ncbi:MAG: hypothetical protein GY917_17240, partial [Planctomycetaceae bacterium]|nr:hypothetical protein [Planctomycetaceae bacterium]
MGKRLRGQQRQSDRSPGRAGWSFGKHYAAGGYSRRLFLEQLEDRRLLATNALPTLDPLSDIIIQENAAEQVVSLTGVTAGNGESQPLRI